MREQNSWIRRFGIRENMSRTKNKSSILLQNYFYIGKNGRRGQVLLSSAGRLYINLIKEGNFKRNPEQFLLFVEYTISSKARGHQMAFYR